ncbi:NAD(P)/FAD-dependent oxidoreductase [Chondromyces apiculatus]|uniref:FAD-binding domain-containing protein n=1 Tax=Chondromyces apiculatus DSM 436 TaxID=1192034 RepID=A0A017T6Y1_9BACT|nr:NAD(P)/FAD-dependent oxidoreductase [Chondromyces apiculatus]EYF05013.1 Hypothetical protein CAP_3603 [Chondromyces apiculatus DSM 436]
MLTERRAVVVGGGPAGAVAALVLSRRGVRTTVLEARPEPSSRPGECLPPSLTPLLRHLGLEDLLAQDGHLRAHGHRFVWGSPRPGERPFFSGLRGDGWHLDRRAFEARLIERARAAGVDFRAGHRLDRVARDGDGWHLEVTSPEGARTTLAADVLADATGRASSVARRLGAQRVRYDRLVGVTARVTRRVTGRITARVAAPTAAPVAAPAAAPLAARPEHAADTFTLVEATPAGWWYSALLADGTLAVAFMTDADLLPRDLATGDPAAFLRALHDAPETRRRVSAQGDRLAAPPQPLSADTSRLTRVAGDGWLALGDAAAAYDPLSSHGIGSAMGSGYYAGHALADVLAGRDDAVTTYLSLLQNAYGAYLDLQRQHYALERRFLDAPFWRRRHAPAYCLDPLDARHGTAA